MTEAALKARREYQRKYYAANREKRKEYNLRYWEKKASEKREKEGNSGNLEQMYDT